jgi:hypothetical protein
MPSAIIAPAADSFLISGWTSEFFMEKKAVPDTTETAFLDYESVFSQIC